PYPGDDRRSPSHEIAGEEEDVGGAFCETTHEVGVPIRTERGGDQHLEALRRDRALEGRPNAVEHLELEPVARDTGACGEPLDAADDSVVVRGHRDVRASAE